MRIEIRMGGAKPMRIRTKSWSGILDKLPDPFNVLIMFFFCFRKVIFDLIVEKQQQPTPSQPSPRLPLPPQWDVLVGQRVVRETGWVCVWDEMEKLWIWTNFCEDAITVFLCYSSCGKTVRTNYVTIATLAIILGKAENWTAELVK
jgi:hypothetical protein